MTPVREIQQIERLAEDLFSKEWQVLNRESLRGRKEWAQPGVYALAYSDFVTVKKPIDDLGSVFYVGMSRAIGSIRSRLRQFLDGIEKDDFHSGARRFFRDYAGSIPFSEWKAR